MAKRMFYCEKCVRNFSANVIEGTKVKCFKCGTIFDVPIYEGLEPVIEKPIFRKPSLLEEWFSSDPVEDAFKDPWERILDKMLRSAKKQIKDKIVETISPENKDNLTFSFICRCPYCLQKYITHVKNKAKIGQCPKCKESFTITELIKK